MYELVSVRFPLNEHVCVCVMLTYTKLVRTQKTMAHLFVCDLLSSVSITAARCVAWRCVAIDIDQSINQFITHKALSTLSQKSETVAEFGDSLTFLRQCGQGLRQQKSKQNEYKMKTT